MADELVVRVRRSDDELMCSLRGRLRRTEMPLLRLVEAAIEQSPPRVLLLDVGSLAGGDLEAFVLLLELTRDLRRAGTVVRLVGTPVEDDAVVPAPREPAHAACSPVRTPSREVTEPAPAPVPADGAAHN